MATLVAEDLFTKPVTDAFGEIKSIGIDAARVIDALTGASAPTPTVDVSYALLPSFKGKLVKRTDEEYPDHRYQYAFSSLPKGTIEPSWILYPAGDDDVLKAVNYAKEMGVSIAVRTGGHQYSGASSTNGKNFQLDMSSTYTDFRVQEDGLVYTGISHALLDFNQMMASNGLFMPTGQCRHVHVGGHVQTGGYGQLARGFGLFGDCVQRIRLITDSPTGAVVREIGRDATDQEEKDLFWAVLGGSPGNFGVLTHLWIRPFQDKDYRNSRGYKGVYVWSKDRMKKVLDFMVDMQCKETPRNFDLCVSVITNSALMLPYMFVGLDVDAAMKQHHPEFWGTDGQKFWPSCIVVYAQYANIPGESLDRPEEWFEALLDHAGRDTLFGKLGVPINYTTPMNMSEITPNWTFLNLREYLLPYEKRTYSTNWTNELKQSGWSEWVSNRIEEVQKGLVFHHGRYLSVQIQPFGGKNSMYYKNGLTNETSYSWRDTTIVAVLDCFYQEPFASHQDAIDWQVQNDVQGIESGHQSKFCNVDRRLLWGSHGNNHNLSDLKLVYYEPGKYDRLLAIKRKIDPKYIFSPNEFCVGGMNPNATVLPSLAMGDVLLSASAVPETPTVNEADMVTKQLARKHERLVKELPKLKSLDPANIVAHSIKHIKADVERMRQQRNQNAEMVKSTINSLMLKDAPSAPKIVTSAAAAFASAATGVPASHLTMSAAIVDVYIRVTGLDVAIKGVVRVPLNSTLKELRTVAEQDGIHLDIGHSFVYGKALLKSKQEERWTVEECAHVDSDQANKYTIDLSKQYILPTYLGWAESVFRTTQLVLPQRILNIVPTLPLRSITSM